MDVDKVIECLLQSGARLDARQDRFERELETMARVGRETARRMDELKARMDETSALQAKSQANFDALMDFLNRRFSGNGHS